MIKTLECQNCHKIVQYSTHGRPIAKYCSRKCAGIVGNKNRVSAMITWDKLSESEALNRLAEQFNARVTKKDGCWEWNGTILDTGYGVIRYRKKMIGSHRASWIIHKGPIPNGQWVLHHCDNPICSNPVHLFLGTVRENVKDMLIKNRHTNRSRQFSKNAKLNAEQVREIKQLFLEKVSQSTLAKKYNVAPGTIQNIKDGRTWRNI